LKKNLFCRREIDFCRLRMQVSSGQQDEGYFMIMRKRFDSENHTSVCLIRPRIIFFTYFDSNIIMCWLSKFYQCCIFCWKIYIKRKRKSKVKISVAKIDIFKIVLLLIVKQLLQAYASQTCTVHPNYLRNFPSLDLTLYIFLYIHLL